ncbi:hypothetical protein [Chlorogloea sp. CCALA 695]|uniref:hypothetical protein n=1 Tax=Chlorogloea sp. CCALA 695 TaxID=2107693 RepID=UPI0018EE44A0|nr:hypothetical protein [Chlorogloea sp. CCALA 695]
MSDYCKHCIYNPRSRPGDKACPFNFFYWDFLARHYDKLKNNHQMSLILRNLERIPPEQLQQMHQLAAAWHEAQ